VASGRSYTPDCEEPDKKLSAVTASRDADFTEYVSARLPTLRRLALLLSRDWQRADDLVQVTMTKLYVHWGRASAADHIDAYARAMLVREFLHERRSGWTRRVSLSAVVPDSPAAAVDQDAALDLRTAVAALAPRQRAAGHCKLTTATPKQLNCTDGSSGMTAKITGQAPAVDGHRAFWTSAYLVWQYARGGWAWLGLPDHRGVGQRHDAVKVADHVRYGAATAPPVAFPVQLTGVPSRWQVSFLYYLPDAGMLRARVRDRFVGSKINLIGWPGRHALSGCAVAARSSPTVRWLASIAGEDARVPAPSPAARHEPGQLDQGADRLSGDAARADQTCASAALSITSASGYTCGHGGSGRWRLARRGG
jgi:hypothetical protein